jgi:hypothetical protein
MSVTTSATAQTTTYTYSGGGAFDSPPFIDFYNEFAIVSPRICPITASFTTAQPIPPNFPMGYITMTSFSISDCANRITNLNASKSVMVAATNAQGQIVDWGLAGFATISVPIVEDVNGIDKTEFTANVVRIESTTAGDTVFYADPSLDFGVLMAGAVAGAYSAGTWTGGVPTCNVPKQEQCSSIGEREGRESLAKLNLYNH